MWDDAGDTYEPVDDHRPGEGEGCREGVEAGAAPRLPNRPGGERKLTAAAGLTFTRESRSSSNTWGKKHFHLKWLRGGGYTPTQTLGNGYSSGYVSGTYDIP